MNRNQAIEIAKTQFAARCRAFMNFWMNGGQAPAEDSFGYHQGWIKVGEFNIGSHEFAPGPTYSED